VAACCNELVLKGKTVILSALSGTYKMEPFESVFKLISIADDIIHCKAICESCKKEAHSRRLRLISSEVVEIGGAELYKQVVEIDKLF
jgi:thymidine kinase